MMFQQGFARASQPPLVREFAEAVNELLDAVDPETVSLGRGLSHSVSRYLTESGSIAYDVPRTRRSRVTWMRAVIRLDAAGRIACECECLSDAAICEHIAAALAKLVDYVAEDDRRLMRLQGMSDKQIEAVEESRRPGRTRWAASAYTAGPDPAAALARTPGALPEPPTAPHRTATPDYSPGAYSLNSVAGGISISELEQQAALAANAALAALNAHRDVNPTAPDGA